MIFGVPSGITLYCVQCDKEVETIVEEGKKLFPNNEERADSVFLCCPFCHNYVMADRLRRNDTFRSWKKRIGKKTIPTAELRKIGRAHV